MKAVAEGEVRDVCLPVILGPAAELWRQSAELGLNTAILSPYSEDLNLSSTLSTPLIYDTGYLNETVSWGTLSAGYGRAAVVAIEACVSFCRAGKLDAMATAPINKESLKLAGSPFPGHTEMITSLCGIDNSLMCFFAGNLRVFLLTIHTSLSDAIASITRTRIVRAIVLVDRELRRFGVERPRIAIAGLNPHASERGLFGNEEQREIEPAVLECREEHKIDVKGPFAADTLFLRAWRGEFDAVGACYHDQGLIAVKCLSFGRAVNVTLGLPIIRTSVDHGTAFDIAGKGIADHGSMVEAIKLAAKLVRPTSGCPN